MPIRYLTHPQVRIDPVVPVPDWGLSDIGQTRTRRFALHPCLSDTNRIVSSGERKALETAHIIASKLGLDVEIREAMAENDRSATGYLPTGEFEAMANRFFAEPHSSICGWERAIDAQTRIVDEMEDVLDGKNTGDVLCIGHGGVGTLLYCHLANLAIDHTHDQPGGGGSYFAFERNGGKVLHGWRSMEAP